MFYQQKVKPARKPVPCKTRCLFCPKMSRGGGGVTFYISEYGDVRAF